MSVQPPAQDTLREALEWIKARADRAVAKHDYTVAIEISNKARSALAREQTSTPDAALAETVDELLEETRLWLPWTPNSTFSPEVSAILQRLAALRASSVDAERET